jgi:serine/threonine-protein kinase
MSYCPECGEEIAEIDSFCPHCGITLEPIAIEAAADDSIDSTIVITQAEISNSIPSLPDTGSAAASPAKEEIADEQTAEIFEREHRPDSDSGRTENSVGDLEETDSVVAVVESEIADNSTAPFLSEPDRAVEPETIEESEVSPDKDQETIPTLEEPVDASISKVAEGRFMSESEIANHPTIDKFLFDELPNEVSSGQIDDVAESLRDTGDFEDREIPRTSSVSEDDAITLLASAPDSVEVKSDDAISEQEAKDLDFVGTDNSVLTNDPANDEGDKPESSPTDPSNFVPKTHVAPIEPVPAAKIAEDQEIKDETPKISPSDSSTLYQFPSDHRITETSKQLTDEVRNEELEFPSVPSILKPEIELEDQPVSPEMSKFDSVSIMEKRDESSEDLSASDENIVPAEEAPISNTVPSGDIEDGKDERSYTSPNMGGSDTDGKRSKLKPLEEGTILNSRYEVIRKIGGGGMGAVYLAADKNLGGVLRAVKEMVQSYIEEAQQDKAINDFKRESMLLTSLEHPSIPTIYDYFYDEKEARFYLVMKYINGGDLSARLRAAPEGRIDEKSVVEWAIQVADVLDYLHKREPPIVYRDLKPANVMIDGNTGKVMLIDFGIARWINKEEKGVTAVGTMGYAPPELFSGNVEPRSDIYSLGSTMFHLLTGADPQSNPLLIFDFQKNPRPRQINPQLSDQIEGILMLSVEYNADKRFASTSEMRRALQDHLENLKTNRVTFGIKESPRAVPLSDEKVFCGFCGQSIVASDLFCAFCGAKQPIAQKGVHSESYSSVPVTARLTILGTNDLDSPSYSIEKDENLVGRRDPMSNIFPEVDLSKFDPQTKISRRHARIWRDGNKFLVEDLGSSNGTILMPVVNEPYRLAPNQPQLLTNGDRLKLGDTTLHFVIG